MNEILIINCGGHALSNTGLYLVYIFQDGRDILCNIGSIYIAVLFTVKLEVTRRSQVDS